MSTTVATAGDASFRPYIYKLLLSVVSTSAFRYLFLKYLRQIADVKLNKDQRLADNREVPLKEFSFVLFRGDPSAGSRRYIRGIPKR